MSDQCRQSLTDKAASSLKPDSQKSTPEQIGDKIKGTADSIASKAQPEDQKSKGQQVGDTLSSDHGGDDTSESLLNKAKNAVGLGDRSTN
ncbi:heat shock protein 9/12-domain-containing protein [Russula ochroleuca]|uniref:Heat shock protein 9/12-domain-containing protein n=1 Tax=Russula ochroleuca TaxID=152965 RepID=A0A9P5TBP1_9AGAM|nr:heat shock protein 9/12-domain-containing protein [Russula ochroleuca]